MMTHRTSVHLKNDSKITSKAYAPVKPNGPVWGTVEIGDDEDPEQISIFFNDTKQLDDFIAAAEDLRKELVKS